MRKNRGYLLKAIIGFVLVTVIAAGSNAAFIFNRAFAYAPPPTDPALIELAGELSRYEITASLNTEDMSLKGNQMVTYRNASQTPLSEVYFHLYPNAFRTLDNAPFAEAELGMAYPNGFSEGGIDINEVLIGDSKADYTLEGDQGQLLKISLGTPLEPGKSVEIGIDYYVKIPNCCGRFGYGKRTISLMNCYPIAAVYDEAGWHLDEYGLVGDPFYSDMADYSATVTVPASYVLAATGRIESRTDILDAYEPADGQDKAETLSVYNIEGPMMRDFAFIVSDKYMIAHETVGDTEVYSYHMSKSSGEAALRAACESLAAYNEMFGEYPYPTYSVCEADFYIGGMEYPTLVLIDTSLYGKNYRDYLEMVVAHETAHQWFYGLVGNNEIEHPWLDEALTEYAMILYYGTRYGETKEKSAYDTWVDREAKRTLREALPIASPSTAFSSNSSYSQVIYSKGTEMLAELRDQLGRDGYIAAVEQYVTDNRFKNVTPEAFYEAIETTSGTDYSGFLDDYLTYVE